MAELRVEDGGLTLELSHVEKAEGLHGDLHAPLSAVRGIEVVDDATEATRIKMGFKVGSRVPGLMTVAVVRRGGRKMFVAVHHDTPRAVRVLLDANQCGDKFDEWIVGAIDPESVVATVNGQLQQ